MNTRRWAIAGTALAVSLSLAVAGCGGSDDANETPSGTPSAAAIPDDPKEALAKSLAGIEKGNFTFTSANAESTLNGVVHAPSKSGSVELKSKPGTDQMAVNIMAIGAEKWMKYDFGPELNEAMKLPADKWQHIDPKKITNPEALKDRLIDFSDPSNYDPNGASAILKALVTAERQDEGKYAGTVDLSQVEDAGPVDKTLVTALGETAKAIAFTASIDAQGLLTQLVLDIPAAGEVTAHKIELNYADYGSATQPKQPPAGEVIEAQDNLYKLLND